MASIVKRVIGLVTALGAVIAPSAGLAWGNEGHHIIALIAADRLTPEARAEVAELLGGDARSAMENASTWADYIRLTRPETAPWHYVNIEINRRQYNPAVDCPSDNCVVAQVEKDARIVADHQLSTPVRTEALRFLIHFVGDLHQPLHCADNYDRGGNEVAVLIGAEQTNLHAVWDNDVVAALGQDPEQVAVGLAARITTDDEGAWRMGSPADWANETFGVARDAVYSSIRGQGGTQAPIILPSNYAALMRPVTAARLERAGVRLALLLNKALARPSTTVPKPADADAQPATSAGADAITPAAAASHVGETAAVRGTVDEVFRSRSGVTFLDMGGRYPNSAFVAVIFPEDASKFPDVESLGGKVVEFTGKLTLYKGRPEVILRLPDQLRVN
jgi:hypothetical protein